MKCLKCELPILAPDAMRYGEWDGVNWQQIEGWRAEFENDRVRWSMHIKKGFVTDGGSIPERLQGRFHPLGYALAAYLVHDALYATEFVPRAEADYIMLELLQDLGKNWINRNMQYAGVRLGGAIVWARHTFDDICKARELVIFNIEYKQGGRMK